MITSKKGDAVLLSKEDWESLQETVYLQSIPGLVESIREAEQTDDWVSEQDFLKSLNGVEVAMVSRNAPYKIMRSRWQQD
jgi:hypothetical protein